MTSRYREARRACNMSPEEAAFKLGVSLSTLTSYEQERTQPNAVVIRHMAELYEVSADWLLMVDIPTEME